MPELPEVEIIRKIIEPQIKEETIRSVKINHAQIIAHPEQELFVQSLTGQDKLRIEPLEDGLTADYLQDKLGKRKKSVCQKRKI